MYVYLINAMTALHFLSAGLSGPLGLRRDHQHVECTLVMLFDTPLAFDRGRLAVPRSRQPWIYFTAVSLVLPRHNTLWQIL
ncbi:uncharacterized protein GGS25DRAFT_477992 [Hypoxylon fragiforme]|uniref:uncharacterized protein n=1 Tax=Hypoxylon fragiforme TaxID=63214 RepID=UPI0020C73546|nr:uncharacterized protein GGS25DRAFT_477992 [Hypoxylon fragiforme]KAI2612978.1 hypothetical protein GGS25DRAFT_477992 [Hypoxylon fragiforme]